LGLIAAAIAATAATVRVPSPAFSAPLAFAAATFAAAASTAHGVDVAAAFAATFASAFAPTFAATTTATRRGGRVAASAVGIGGLTGGSRAGGHRVTHAGLL
jgi:hypothetical protein